MTAAISSGPETHEHEADMHETLSKSSCHPRFHAGEGQELEMGCPRQPQIPSHRPPPPNPKSSRFQFSTNNPPFPWEIETESLTLS